MPYSSIISGAVASAACALWLSSAAIQQSLAPFHASAPDVVDRMLALAGVTERDLVVDLGCGDGRVPIRAAQKYGARGLGVDIDPRLIDEAKANARTAGVAHLVEFRVEDAMTTDVSGASVVMLYLLSSSNAKLRPVLLRQLKPGARIVSHAFSMGADWPADRVDRFTSASGDQVTLYLWRIPTARTPTPAPGFEGQRGTPGAESKLPTSNSSLEDGGGTALRGIRIPRSGALESTRVRRSEPSRDPGSPR